jgi:hypothetical protein
MQATQSTLTFAGSKEEQQIAEEVFTQARFHGRYFTSTAPIALKREGLLGFLTSQHKDVDAETLGQRLDAAMSKNPGVFARAETDDGVVTFITTILGTTPVAPVEDLGHTLRKRFMDPIAAPPPPPVAPKKPAPMIAEGWSQRPVFTDLSDDLDGLDSVQETAEDLDATPSSTPGIPALEPEVMPTGGEDVMVAAAPLPTESIAPAPSPAPDVPLAAPAAPAEQSLAQLPVEAVRTALAARLAGDDRFVSFGDRFFPEDMVDRYSRGDLRRIREYIVEMNEPLSDEQLLQGLFNRRTNDPSYESARFSINYRLSREKREFEFVGTRDARLWSTTGLAPLGTTLRKASELGTDYRYLLDEPAEEAGASVTHVVTFFEWAYGLLPLDGTLASFFPTEYLDDQKTATVRFEVPQLYVTFLAELRYPTGSRGGYLAGFDEFYRENVLPGSVLTLERTPNNNGQFIIRYGTVPAREERTLQIDERRNRYVFRPQQITTEVDEGWLLSEGRYPNLNNVKPLDDKERRRADVVVGAAFERAAENVGTKSEPRYWSAPEELLPVVNIERPFSLRALREVMESPQYPQFVADADTPGAFFYEPPMKEKAATGSKKRSARNQAEDEDEDEDEEF